MSDSYLTAGLHLAPVALILIMLYRMRDSSTTQLTSLNNSVTQLIEESKDQLGKKTDLVSALRQEMKKLCEVISEKDSEIASLKSRIARDGETFKLAERTIERYEDFHKSLLRASNGLLESNKNDLQESMNARTHTTQGPVCYSSAFGQATGIEVRQF